MAVRSPSKGSSYGSRDSLTNDSREKSKTRESSHAGQASSHSSNTPKQPLTPAHVREPIAEEATASADERDRFDGSSLQATHRFDVDSSPNKTWLDLQFTDKKKTNVVTPDQLEKQMQNVPKLEFPQIADRIAGSMFGMAVGDALGAHVEFRPHDFLVEHPVHDLSSGGTWGLKKGQFTDDTSMALCLAISLISCREFDLYDQLVRYKWWHRYGYMSSTGQCFDIGKATKQSIDEFAHRQYLWAEKHKIPAEQIDHVRDPPLLKDFDVLCSKDGVAGNGALMRLAPVPLFFFRDPPMAVEYSGQSGEITHGDQRAIDSCRYYGALIVAALQECSKEEILDNYFYDKHHEWFGKRPLHADILKVAQGSYKKDEGYGSGIRGSGYTVQSLEAALWAFWSTENFEDGALAAVNLGDDTDTTAAIYGQLAGCFYGFRRIPEKWRNLVFARHFISNVSEWIGYEGAHWCHRTNHEAYRRYQARFDRQEPKKGPADKKVPAPLAGAALASSPKPSPKPPKPPEPPEPRASTDGKDLKVSVPVEENCPNWSTDDVYRWLMSKGKPLCDQAEEFKKQKVNGARLLRILDEKIIPFDKWAGKKEELALTKEVKNLQLAVAQKFNEPFQGADYTFAMHVFEKTTNKTSILLREKDAFLKPIHGQIIHWMEDLPNGMGVNKIELLCEPNRLRLFLEQVIASERKKQQLYLDPHFKEETNPDERQRTLERLKQLERRVNHRREISVIRVWYGCTVNEMKVLTKEGFRREDTKKQGPFGNGIYFNSSAISEAYRAGIFGCLIMCYVILVNPYPIIADDAPLNKKKADFHFYGRQPKGTYDSHYIPVGRFSAIESDVKELPPPGGVQDAEYDRIVVFNLSNILQQCVVHLQNSSKPSDVKSSSTAAPRGGLGSVGSPKKPGKTSKIK